ncbi:hypothetical protein EG829_17640 [bacterium]|nr:hypothetical protein [bacterium]
MSQTFTCSNCGATLEYNGTAHMMKCSFCNGNAEVPERLWQAAESAKQEVEIQQTQKKWGKYLLIFLAITVGLPTCLGLVGTLVAVVLGFGGTLIGILAPFLIK